MMPVAHGALWHHGKYKSMSIPLFTRRVKFTRPDGGDHLQVVQGGPPAEILLTFATDDRDAVLAGRYDPPTGLTLESLRHTWDALAGYARRAYGPAAELFGYELLADGTFNLVVIDPTERDA
jgi:hypothetical protein